MELITMQSIISNHTQNLFQTSLDWEKFQKQFWIKTKILNYHLLKAGALSGNCQPVYLFEYIIVYNLPKIESTGPLYVHKKTILL